MLECWGCACAVGSGGGAGVRGLVLEGDAVEGGGDAAEGRLRGKKALSYG